MRKIWMLFVVCPTVALAQTDPQPVAPGIGTQVTTPPGQQGALVVLPPAGQPTPRAAVPGLHIEQSPQPSQGSPVQVVSPVDQGGAIQSHGISVLPPAIDPGLVPPSPVPPGQGPSGP